MTYDTKRSLKQPSKIPEWTVRNVFISILYFCIYNVFNSQMLFLFKNESISLTWTMWKRTEISCLSIVEFLKLFKYILISIKWKCLFCKSCCLLTQLKFFLLLLVLLIIFWYNFFTTATACSWIEEIAKLNYFSTFGQEQNKTEES